MRKAAKNERNEGYTVTAVDGRRMRPIMIDDGAKTPLGAKRKANAMIRELEKDGNGTAQVYVSYNRGGGPGYLNRGGHSREGTNWRTNQRRKKTLRGRKG